MRKDLKDITDQTFGRLFVIKYLYTNNNGVAVWLCKCECGNLLEVSGTSLRKGHTRSCGCLHKDLLRQRFTKHGHNKKGSPSRTYKTWGHLESRCYNIKDDNYKYYGERGITVCDKWRGEHGFENFLADMGERPENRSLDRINNDGPYSPDNCRWATREEQMNNTRERVGSLSYTYNNTTATLSQWSRITGINYQTLFDRIKRYNWSIEKALTTPVRKNRPRKNK